MLLKKPKSGLMLKNNLRQLCLKLKLKRFTEFRTENYGKSSKMKEKMSSLRTMEPY